MNTAKSLNRVNSSIVPNGKDPWAVLVKVDGKSIGFTVQRYYASIHGYKGYKIRTADGLAVQKSHPSTLEECANLLLDLAKESN